MKNYLSLSYRNAITALCFFGAFTMNPTTVVAQNSAEYRAAYECAMDSIQEGYPGGPAAFCVGNSRDPSPIEEQAYADAEIAFKAKATKSQACTFSYAIWIGSGSRADDWLEGPQIVKSLQDVASLLPGREISFFDETGQPIEIDTAAKWFARKGEYDLVVSDYAKQSCSPQQIQN